MGREAHTLSSPAEESLPLSGAVLVRTLDLQDRPFQDDPGTKSQCHLSSFILASSYTSVSYNSVAITEYQSILLGVVETQMNQPQTCPPETYSLIKGKGDRLFLVIKNPPVWSLVSSLHIPGLCLTAPSPVVTTVGDWGLSLIQEDPEVMEMSKSRCLWSDRELVLPHS